MSTPDIVSRAEWLAAREALLEKEKHLTRMRDQLNAERRALPWVRVEKPYVFDSAGGSKTLADLFDGRSQLIVQHFMFSPDWEEGCIGCSFGSDHIEAALVHLEHHDVSFARVSRAPLAKLLAFQKRMGWRGVWVSSLGSDFNYDFGVSFRKPDVLRGEVYYNYRKTKTSMEDLSGLSVFCRSPDGELFHTYSTYARGDELIDTTYMLLDLTPKGRNENGPHYNLVDWVRHHDRYDDVRRGDATA